MILVGVDTSWILHVPQGTSVNGLGRGDGHQETLLAFAVALRQRCNNDFPVIKWLPMRNKTLSYFLHSSDGGNSVKRLKLDTDHDEKNQGMSQLLHVGSCVSATEQQLSWG